MHYLQVKLSPPELFKGRKCRIVRGFYQIEGRITEVVQGGITCSLFNFFEPNKSSNNTQIGLFGNFESIRSLSFLIGALLEGLFAGLSISVLETINGLM